MGKGQLNNILDDQQTDQFDGDEQPHCGWDFFRLLAISSCAISLFSVLFLAISVPILCAQLGTERANIGQKADKFKEDSNRIWNRIHESVPAPSAFPRDKRAQHASGNSAAGHATAGGCGCSALSCPQGPPGPAGQPGQDNAPGKSGETGPPGEDGMDIVMESELDLPCIVCPGGPPGQRGNQGERGAPGPVGASGEAGTPGKEGTHGTQGKGGPAGLAGGKGVPGHGGPPGDQVISGIGIKGPRGKQGPVGPSGSPGMPGKRQMANGPVGPTGAQGPPGELGNVGRAGMPGEPGGAGEPGMPSAYCPSDCGVSHIKVPAFQMEGGNAEGMPTANYKPDAEKVPTPSARTTMAPRQYSGGSKGKTKREKKSGKMQRHPTGGYYRTHTSRLEGGPDN